jgi:uncharacterized coiled-coil DUF342 family protein
MSKYQPSLRELAMEPDEDKRLEMAARIDEDVAELDDRWDEREGWRNEREEWDAERDSLNAELDEAIAERDRYREERDESRRKYADRFFDAPSDTTVLHVTQETEREPIRSADEIWD